MALTNDSAQKISENINAGNVNDNIEVERSERVRRLSPEAAILFDKSIIARPLNTPEVCSIHVRNTEYYYRWVAHQALGGRVYMERKAMGFTEATTDDVDILVGDAVANNGQITAGDLILMKLPFHRWAEHVKSNMQKAQTLGNMRGVFMKSTSGDRLPSTDPMSDDKPVRASVSNEPFQRGMVTNFIPENPDAIINDSIDSGRVEKTRADLQERQKAR